MRAAIRKLINISGWVAAVISFLALAALLIGVKLQRDYTAKAAGFPLEQIGVVPQRSAVYDANGKLYSHLPGMNRQVVEFGQVSGWFVQALLAREDARFWEHHGIELRSILRAAVANLRGGGIRQGASTITQQLARNAFELGGRTYERKALEAALSVRIEKTFSKKQILELYMNRIYFGAGLYGIEAAARGYFEKPAAELSLGESAILAGLVCSPNKFSPAKHPDIARRERDEVLARMQEEHMVTPQDVAAAKALKVETTKTPAFPSIDDYFTDAVNRALAEVLDPEVIERGGLRVMSTIDPELQKQGQEAAECHLAHIEAQKKYPHPKRAAFVAGVDDKGADKPTDYLQAAVVVVDNRTGAIRACVGGRDYNESKYHRALLAQRQIGSTFKPFVYAAAFERGLLPGTLVSDDKIAPGEFKNIPKNWSPDNSDGDYLGLQPAAFGLIKSRNTMSVRIGEMVGLHTVSALANSLGIGEKMQPYPVSFLGAFETNLRDLTAAYTVFPNGGRYRQPYLIARVENEKGETLFTANPKERQAIRPEASWMVTSCLQEVMRTGTAAKAAQLGWKKPGAGKTGTTNDFHDAWFVGYTQSLTCGVWVGMDKPETIMEKGYGSALALPIWVDVMQSAPEQLYPAPPLRPPVPLMKVRLCSASGALAGSGCEAAHSVYESEVPAGRVPQQRCTVHADPLPVAPPIAPQNPAPSVAPQIPAPSYASQSSGLPYLEVEKAERSVASSVPGLPAGGQPAPAPAPVAQYVPPPPAVPPVSAPAPPAYPATAARPAPPLYINGNRVADDAPAPVIVRRISGGRSSAEIASGSARSPELGRTAVSWRTEEGVRVMRAAPPERDDADPRATTAPAEPELKVRHDRGDRDDETDSGDHGRRRGLLHRIFSSRN